MNEQELTFSEMVKIAEKGNFILLSNEEWKAFTKKLFTLDCRVKDLEKKRKYWEEKYKQEKELKK
jgi:hypothetical protein